MSRTEANDTVNMDISLSPSTSTQCPENISPSSSCVKMMYSKIISSCQRSNRMTSVVTPENKENCKSPFIRKKVPFNPFNRNLKERLENPIFSPDVFSTVISPSQDSKEFKWTIDDLSKINPAPIEEEFYFEEPVDEITESEMQKTIDKYFTKTHMVPSPWDCKLPTSWSSFREVFKKEKQVLLNEHGNKTVASSPYSFSLSRLELVSNSSSHNVCTQTALSLPPDLPDEINTALKPYFTEDSLDDINLSMNSLRRKLFFQNEDEPLSPVRFFNMEEVSPLISSCYPSTPVIDLRTDGSPLEKLSPLDVSPISRAGKEFKCNNSSSAMQIDSSTIDLPNTQDNTHTDQSCQRFAVECFKVFESPKLAGSIRRSRKRRRSCSEDMNMSISYSTFAAKNCSTGQMVRRLCAFEETKTNSVEMLSENFTVSQDTGYYSETTSTEKCHRGDSIVKVIPFDNWKNANKEHLLVASTPTKDGNGTK